MSYKLTQIDTARELVTLSTDFIQALNQFEGQRITLAMRSEIKRKLDYVLAKHCVDCRYTLRVYEQDPTVITITPTNTASAIVLNSILAVNHTITSNSVINFAVEFGYKQCEKGNNLQMSIYNWNKLNVNV